MVLKADLASDCGETRSSKTMPPPDPPMPAWRDHGTSDNIDEAQESVRQPQVSYETRKAPTEQGAGNEEAWDEAWDQARDSKAWEASAPSASGELMPGISVMLGWKPGVRRGRRLQGTRRLQRLHRCLTSSGHRMTEMTLTETPLQCWKRRSGS